VDRRRDCYSRLRHGLRLHDHAAAWGLGIAYVALLLATSQIGFTRDESYYFRAGREYAGWFVELWNNLEAGRVLESFTQASVDRHWGYNPEHPVLMKTLFGLSERLFHAELGWLSPSTAFRFPAMVTGGMIVALTFLFAVEVSGRRLAGWIAALSIALMPHFFFHAHLTCFDIPIMAVWLIVMYAYWKSLDSTGWAWATGALWGIGLITKLNAFFIPFVLLTHWAVAGYRDFAVRNGRLVVPRVPLALFTMAALGPVIFYLGWPRRIRWYLAFHAQHEHYFVDYLGQNLWKPPFPVEYPFVLTAITTPVVILAVLVGGIAAMTGASLLRALRRERGDTFGTGVFLALNAIVPFAIIAMPSSPVFGGVKHWMPALPFMAVAGGWAVAHAIDAVAGRNVWLRVTATAVALVALVVPAALATARSHPFGISYYNEVIGGYSGAADADTMRQFWGYASRQSLPWVNAHAVDRARINFSDTTHYAFDMYREQGELRQDIGYYWRIDGADYVLFDQQKSFANTLAEIWDRFETRTPVETVNIEGVPLISIYAATEHRTQRRWPVDVYGIALPPESRRGMLDRVFDVELPDFGALAEPPVARRRPRRTSRTVETAPGEGSSALPLDEAP
jgi:4-amino-4-deoxy-L-arabinose transferase-like glycosyltransferase